MIMDMDATRLERKMDGLQSSVGEMAVVLARVEERGAGHRDDVGELRAQIARLEVRIGKTEAKTHRMLGWASAFAALAAAGVGIVLHLIR